MQTSALSEPLTSEIPKRVEALRIGLVGGIYGKGRDYRETIRDTPETILEFGLRAQGHQVNTFSHYDRLDLAGFEEDFA